MDFSLNFLLDSPKLSLSEKCSNTDFFLIHIFPYSDQKKLRIWTIFTQCYSQSQKSYLILFCHITRKPISFPSRRSDQKLTLLHCYNAAVIRVFKVVFLTKNLTLYQYNYNSFLSKICKLSSNLIFLINPFVTIFFY